MSPAATIDIGPASGPDTVLKPASKSTELPSAREDPEHEEYQYLDLIEEILENGEHRPDR